MADKKDKPKPKKEINMQHELLAHSWKEMCQQYSTLGNHMVVIGEQVNAVLDANDSLTRVNKQLKEKNSILMTRLGING